MFKKTILDSGITVVTETHRHQRSVAVGVFVCSGTRDEDKSMVGASHFVEHMVFKGTKKRSSYEISRSIEAVGGELNAFTTREYTCFHATSLKENLALDVEVLGDLITNATFRPKDFEKERKVILQEVAMTEDNVEEYAFDIFFEKIYPKSSLGWPILGTEKSLNSMTRNKLLSYYRSHYVGANIIVAAAGALDHDEVVALVDKFIKVKKGKRTASRRRVGKPIPAREVVEKNGEQTHLIVGFDGVGFTDEKRFDAFILNAWLGGGMSSKLYQSIREKRGLAYTVYSQLITLTDGGLLTVYAGCDEDSVKKVMTAICDDLKRVMSKKINPSALDLFKQQVRGSILLGADDMENRMTSLGVNEMTFADYMPVEKVVDGVEAVTAKEVWELSQEILDPKKMSVLALGPVKASELKYFLSQLGHEK